MALTDLKIRQTAAPTSPLKLTDGGGLYIEIKPNGSKLWRYRYRIAGKENVFALGAYPTISLQDARRMRDDARALVKQGIHPSHARQSEKAHNIELSGILFRTFADEWMEEKKQTIVPYYYQQIERGFREDIYPFIGNLPLWSIKTIHVYDIVDRVRKRGAPSVAINLRQWMSQVFVKAIVNGLIESDPAAPLHRTIQRGEINHAQAMNSSEITEFIKRLDKYGGNRTTVIALNLMMLTFVRTNELRHAQWTQFDLERRFWIIEAGRMKLRRKHLIPLAAQAVALIEELRGITGANLYLFPNNRDPRKCMSPTTINRAIEYLGYEPATWTGHDFRATAQTQLLEMGFEEDHTEVQLAHAKRSKTKAAYNHAKYLRPRIKMMQTWADWLDERRNEARVESPSSKSGSPARDEMARIFEEIDRARAG